MDQAETRDSLMGIRAEIDALSRGMKRWIFLVTPRRGYVERHSCLEEEEVPSPIQTSRASGYLVCSVVSQCSWVPALEITCCLLLRCSPPQRNYIYIYHSV